MEERKENLLVCTLGFIIGILVYQIFKLNLKIKELQTDLGTLSETLAKFIDLDRSDKKEIIKAISLIDMNKIIDRIRSMSWEKFTNSDYYYNPINYTNSTNTLKARTMLYMSIINDTYYYLKDNGNFKILIAELIDYINNYTANNSGYDKYYPVIPHINKMRLLINKISSEKIYVNALESYLKDKWEKEIML